MEINLELWLIKVSNLFKNMIKSQICRICVIFVVLIVINDWCNQWQNKSKESILA
jgi:hypothetical protein